MYFCYGWVFWMYLQWLPTYLSEVRHFAKSRWGWQPAFRCWPRLSRTWPGGWLSDKLARMWGDLRRGRVVVAVAGFTLAGLAILPGVLANNALTGWPA